MGNNLHTNSYTTNTTYHCKGEWRSGIKYLGQVKVKYIHSDD